MEKIICKYCKKEIEIKNLVSMEIECPNCLSKINLKKMKKVELIYQKTGGKITLHIYNEKILGRENYGKEILKDIPQISRKHCKLMFQDNKIYIIDLNSLNGTYIGLSKVDCKEKKILSNKEIIYLGQEMFIVLYDEDNLKKNKIIVNKFECQNCHNFISEKKEFTCPKCHTYND